MRLTRLRFWSCLLLLPLILLHVLALLFNHTPPLVEYPLPIPQEHATPEMKSFPRWNSTVWFPELVKAATACLNEKTTYASLCHDVYLLDGGTASPPRLLRAGSPPKEERWRASVWEPLALRALQTYTATQENYPFLRAALDRGGLLFLVNFGDSHLCADNNATKIPIFSLSAPIDCNHTFPIPNYETIIVSRYGRTRRRFKSLQQTFKFPWSKQIRKAIWRGTATGPDEHNLRKALCKVGLDHPDWIDAKLVGEPRWSNTTHLYGSRMVREEFQTYRAILDVDGNSWSSRFGELLCYHSVIVKVQPDDVDFFFSDLRPWYHYIPVQADFSDLLKNVQFAVSDDPVVHRIVQNANEWCRNKMNWNVLANDMLRIWNEYAKYLIHDNDPNLWKATLTQLRDTYLFARVRG